MKIQKKGMFEHPIGVHKGMVRLRDILDTLDGEDRYRGEFPPINRGLGRL